MAESIDELQIDIKVKDNNSAKQIDAITLAINNLTKALSGLNKFSNVLDNLAKMKISSVARNVKAAMDGKTPSLDIKETQNNTEKSTTRTLATDVIDKDSISAKLAEVREKMASLSSGLSELNPQMELLDKATINSIVTFKEFGKDIEKVNQDISGSVRLITEDEYAVDRLKIAVGQLDGTFNLSGESAKEAAEAFGYTKEELDAMEKPVKKATSAFGKFTKAIGRIALYRAIRFVLKGITNAAKEGLENIRSENKALDESLNKISLAGTSLKNSFASMLAPIIQSVEPFITKLADGLARIVNRFSEAQAAMQGQSKYTKILTSDMEEYKKQLDKTNGSLLEFDTFTTLSTKDEYTGVTEADVTMSQEEAKKYHSTLKDIVETLQEVVELIIDIIGLVSELSITAGDVIHGIVLQIKGAIQIIRGFIKLLMGDLEGAGIDLTNGFKNMLKGILKFIIGALNVIVDLINLLVINLNPLKWILDLVGVDTSGFKIPHIPTSWINSFATGGNFQTADLFYANENGQTELIASSNSGGGAVMNMEQLRSAIYEGMVMAMSEGGTSEQAVYLDGNKVGTFVAGNVGFRNEANRRNTGLNWR